MMNKKRGTKKNNFVDAEERRKILNLLISRLIDDKEIFIKIVASASCLAMENCCNYV